MIFILKTFGRNLWALHRQFHKVLHKDLKTHIVRQHYLKKHNLNANSTISMRKPWFLRRFWRFPSSVWNLIFSSTPWSSWLPKAPIWCCFGTDGLTLASKNLRQKFIKILSKFMKNVLKTKLLFNRPCEPPCWHLIYFGTGNRCSKISPHDLSNKKFRYKMQK